MTRNKPPSLYKTPLGSFELFRSFAGLDNQLQAWDSADEYLINHLCESCLLEGKSILVFNDLFGGLSLPVLKQLQSDSPLLGRPNAITVVGDSFVSEQAIKSNCEVNKLDHKLLNFLTENKLKDVSAHTKYDLVLMKIPKAIAHLQWQLLQILEILEPGTLVIAADKTKRIHTSTVKCFENHFASVKTSLAVKKSRLIISQDMESIGLIGGEQVEGESVADSLEQVDKQAYYELPDYQLKLSSAQSVFSSGKLDFGSQLLLQSLPQLLNDSNAKPRIMDLGCGNGVLGLAAKHMLKETQLVFVDESYSSINSARDNYHLNFSTDDEKESAEIFIVDDVLSHTLKQDPPLRVDMVLCNPPFHQQNAMGKHTAHRMIRQSHQVLNKGGSLCLVGNRHLAYHVAIKKVFANCEVVKSNSKFTVLRAIK